MTERQAGSRNKAARAVVTTTWLDAAGEKTLLGCREWRGIPCWNEVQKADLRGVGAVPYQLSYQFSEEPQTALGILALGMRWSYVPVWSIRVDNSAVST